MCNVADGNRDCVRTQSPTATVVGGHINDWRCAATLLIVDAVAGGHRSSIGARGLAARGRFRTSAVGTNVG